MGQFRVEVTAVGNHGCERETKDGGTVTGCGSPGCTDCLTSDFVEKLRSIGTNVESASITHWPGQPSEVVDTYDTPVSVETGSKRIRKGSF